jgi:LDH2 family malate/lactate/ureidoglycolate dehydrogenase
MNIAIEKAHAIGSSCVAVRNSHHFGAAGYYAHMALEHDMIGFALTNAGPIVLPTFGLQPQVGTNPIALAIPAEEEPPFVLDMATSVKAVGKLEILMREGKLAPSGWLMSSAGELAQDPEAVLRGRRSEGLGGLLPLGGAGEDTSGYKGFGLALAVEILAPLLAGDRPSPFMEIGVRGSEPSIGHFFAAIRIDAFRPVPEFKREVDRILRHIKASPPAPGHERVFVAGEKEYETLQERSRQGIPLHPKVVQDLELLAQDLGAAPPEPLARQL